MKPMKWWQQTVFYQIYPRSFADSNGDGIGDFPGITARLDYLRDLGIGAIWLSPHYPSPFLDCGYDISDYSSVAPEYGSLEDFKHFLNEAHERGIRVILDLVLNHTSDEHPWFVESKANKNNPKRDWYVWRDGKEGGGPPNNWASIFGGSAWELDPATGQYYYHAFLKEQPDLNWRNLAVKQAMWDMVRYWLDLGVDGFRLDALATIFEHPDLPDQTLVKSADEILDANTLTRAEYEQLMTYQLHQSGIHELLKELRTIIAQYPGDRVLVGEDEDVAYHGSGDDELDLLFNFPLMRADRLTPRHIRDNQALRLAELPPGAWPCNTLGNHDTSRMWSRYGDGLHDAELARVHLALVLTLKGTPFLYNGEEIGMSDLALEELSQVRDTMALLQYRLLTEKKGHSPQEALHKVLRLTRDRCRSPFQWSSEPNAGFTMAGVTPWLPVNVNYTSGVNVAAQANNPGSLHNFYRQLINLRQSTPALIGGDYQVLNEENEDYFAFLRQDPENQQTCLVALNFSHEEQAVILEGELKNFRVLYSSAVESGNSDKRLTGADRLILRPFEVFIAQLT